VGYCGDLLIFGSVEGEKLECLRRGLALPRPQQIAGNQRPCASLASLTVCHNDILWVVIKPLMLQRRRRSQRRKEKRKKEGRRKEEKRKEGKKKRGKKKRGKKKRGKKERKEGRRNEERRMKKEG